MWSLRVISQAGLTWPSSNRSCAREGARHPGCTPCSSSGGDPLPRPSHYARLTRRAGPRARRAPPSTPVASAAAASSPGLSRLASTSAPLSWVPTRCISSCFASCIVSCITSCISDRATSPVWPLTLQGARHSLQQRVVFHSKPPPIYCTPPIYRWACARPAARRVARAPSPPGLCPYG